MHVVSLIFICVLQQCSCDASQTAVHFSVCQTASSKVMSMIILVVVHSKTVVLGWMVDIRVCNLR
jgi:hypothetical protein